MNWENITLWAFLAIVAVGWALVGVVSAVAKNWRKARESEHLAALKQSMVEKGMPADEIERVVNAGRKVKEDDD
jgi:hypothetical protein